MRARRSIPAVLTIKHRHDDLTVTFEGVSLADAFDYSPTIREIGCKIAPETLHPIQNMARPGKLATVSGYEIVVKILKTSVPVTD